MAYKINKQYRLQGYDYSQNGAYFITINTKDRQHFFGEIKEKVMYLSEIGKYVESNFDEIKNKISYLDIPEYSILPNHIHLIIRLKTNGNKKEFTYGLRPLISNSISSFCNHLKGNIKNWSIKKKLTFVGNYGFMIG